MRSLEEDKYFQVLDKYRWALKDMKVDLSDVINRSRPFYDTGMPFTKALIISQAPFKEIYTVAYMARYGINSFYQIEPQNIDLFLYEKVSISICEKYGVCLLRKDGDLVEYAFSSPSVMSEVESQIIQAFPEAKTRGYISLRQDIDSALNTVGVRLSEAKAVKISDSLTVETNLVENLNATIVRNSEEASLVQQIIETCYRMRASDLHFDPSPNGLRVRYRVDGVLNDHASLIPLDVGRRVLNYIKTRAGLETALNLGPQDGRFTMSIDNKNVDFRVGVITTSQELSKITLRVLTSATMRDSLVSLGYEPVLLSNFRTLLSLNSGLILVTGPVGSGKTTTLYSSLHHIYRDTMQIMSVEDPVEYEMLGINQIPIQRNMTFATALRSLVRHDFDVLMIGEIRDQPTAAISIESAITGRLILSSLHTPDALTAPIRLRNMGIEPYQISTALKGVLAQRLVRELCSCKVPAEVVPDSIDWPDGTVPKVIYQANGCLACNHTGYLGRFAVGELLVVNDEISFLLASSQVDIKELRHLAEENGFVPMRQKALTKVEEGATSLDEVLRIFSFSSENFDELNITVEDQLQMAVENEREVV
jgi:type II secretory ATPase GspE/PulE/Tfp pilus assembly ATPase PilB-like protein